MDTQVIDSVGETTLSEYIQQPTYVTKDNVPRIFSLGTNISKKIAELFRLSNSLYRT